MNSGSEGAEGVNISHSCVDPLGLMALLYFVSLEMGNRELLFGDRVISTEYCDSGGNGWLGKETSKHGFMKLGKLEILLRGY